METPLQRVDRLLEDTGKTWADLARLLRYSEQRLTNWKARGVPRAELPEVAKVLGVSIDYIATGTSAAPATTALTPDEQTLVDLYRCLTKRQKGDTINNIEAQKQANDVIIRELTQRRA